MPSTPSITPNNICCHTDFNLDNCLDGGDIDIYRGFVEYLNNESIVDVSKVKPEDLVKFYTDVLKKEEDPYIPIDSVGKVPTFDCANFVDPDGKFLNDYDIEIFRAYVSYRNITDIPHAQIDKEKLNFWYKSYLKQFAPENYLDIGAANIENLPTLRSQVLDCPQPPTPTGTATLTDPVPTSTISTSLSSIPPKYNHPQYVDCYVPDWKTPNFYSLDSFNDPFTGSSNESCDWLTNGPSESDRETKKYDNWSAPVAAAIQLGHLNACPPCELNLPTDGKEYDLCKEGNTSTLNTVQWDDKKGWNDFSLDGPLLRPGRESWLGSKCDHEQTDFGWYMNTNKLGTTDHDDTYDRINLAPAPTGTVTSTPTTTLSLDPLFDTPYEQGTHSYNVYRGINLFYKNAGYSLSAGFIHHKAGENYEGVYGGTVPALFKDYIRTSDENTAAASQDNFWNLIKSEIDNNRITLCTLGIKEENWKTTKSLSVISAGDSKVPPVDAVGYTTTAELKEDQFDIQYIKISGALDIDFSGNGSAYYPDLAIGQTLAIIGYIEAGSSYDIGDNTNWVIVHDTSNSTARNIAIPFNNKENGQNSFWDAINSSFYVNPCGATKINFPCPTESATSTISGTGTSTKTATTSETGSSTPVPTGTSTKTATTTATLTPVPTGTVTTSETGSSTPVPTGTVTTSETGSSTPVPTGTVTTSETGSSTPVPTGTVTTSETGSSTPVPTGTVTTSETGSSTPVPTGTVTTSETGSSTPVPTGTVTTSETGSSTPVPTGTVTTSETGTATTSETGTATTSETGTATTSETGSSTPVPTGTVTTSETGTATTSETGTATTSETGTATTSETGSSTPVPTGTATTSETGTATPTATTTIIIPAIICLRALTPPSPYQMGTYSLSSGSAGSADAVYEADVNSDYTIQAGIDASTGAVINWVLFNMGTAVYYSNSEHLVGVGRWSDIEVSADHCPTPTVTGTGTPTVTGTTSVSITGTPTVTGTTSVSITGTPTVTGTTSVSITGTTSVSIIGTPTVTGTTSVSITGTPTVTGTTSVSITGTTSVSITGTPTVTGTTSVSITGTPTVTGTTSVSITGTPTVTGTTSVSITGTTSVSITGTPTVTGTTSVSITGTPTVTGTTSVSITGTPTVTGTTSVSITGTTSVSITGTPTVTGTTSVSITGTTSVSITGTPTVTGTTSVSTTGTPTVTGTGTPTVTGTTSVSITGTPTVTGTTSVSITGTTSVSITGTPTVTGTTSVSITGTPTVTGTTSVSITGTPTVTGTTSVSITGTTSVSITGTPTVTGTTSVSITGTPTVTGTTSVSTTGTPTVTGTGTPTVTGTGTPTVTGTGTPTVTGTTSVSITGTSTPTVTGTTSVSITGTPTVTGTSTPTATGTIVPTVTGTATPTATGTYTRADCDCGSGQCLTICLFMEDEDREWRHMPDPSSTNLDNYNSKLTELKLENLTEGSQLVLLRKLFEQKVSWESLLSPATGHTDAVPSDLINSKSKCKWSDADVSILVSFSPTSAAGTQSGKEYGAQVIESTSQKILTSSPSAGTLSTVTGLPYKSMIILPSEITGYVNPNGTSDPVDPTNTKLNITIKRLTANALGWSIEEMESKGLIERHTATNECGEVISESWPIFTGANALSEYRSSTSNAELKGIPLQGYTGTIESMAQAFDQSESWWHTNLDPDYPPDGGDPRVDRRFGYKSHRDPVEPENDFRFDGNIFLTKVADPSPIERIRSSQVVYDSSVTIPSLKKARNPYVPASWRSGVLPDTNRQDKLEQLVCHPGISNDSLNSHPFKEGHFWNHYLPIIKTPNEEVTTLTISAFKDMGYGGCDAAGTSAIDSCQPTPLCCRLAVDVLEGQTTLSTTITAQGRRRIYPSNPSGNTWESEPLDGDDYHANVYYVERDLDKELLILNTHNIDNQYTGYYSYSISSAVGVGAALLGWSNNTISASSTRIVDPRNIAYGVFGYARRLLDIPGIDHDQRYLHIFGKGAGIVKIKVRDEAGCEEIITLDIAPAKFNPCQYVMFGLQPLTIKINDPWPNILVASPAGVEAGYYSGVGLPGRTPPASGQLGWAWDDNRLGQAYDIPGKKLLDPFLNLPRAGVSEGGGQGTYDTAKLGISISITGGFGPYTFAPLSNSVYVAREPSDWECAVDGNSIPPDGFHCPHPSFESPPPKVSGALNFGVKEGFIYGGDQPYFESSAEMPGGTTTKDFGSGPQQITYLPWGDEVNLYANRPGDRCFFRVFDANGCPATVELKVPCSSDVLHPPAGGVMGADQGNSFTDTAPIADIFQGYEEHRELVTFGNKATLHLNIGLGEEEKASLCDILKYTSAPTCAFHLSGADPAVDPALGMKDFNEIGGYWHLTCGVNYAARDESEQQGSAMWTTNANGDYTNDNFRIPGLTHEVFTGKEIKFKLKQGEFFKTFQDLQLEQNANTILANRNGREMKVGGANRAVFARRGGNKTSFKGINTGIGVFNYSIDDGGQGCDLPIMVRVTPPEVIYGDFIQGHIILNRPWEGPVQIDTPGIFMGDVIRIEEQLSNYNQILMNGLPTLYGGNHYPWGADGQTAFPQVPPDEPGQLMTSNRTKLRANATTCPPFCPYVIPGPYPVPLGISIPCGKGFYGIKISSDRMNYHESNMIYHVEVDGTVLNNGRPFIDEHIGWYSSIGAPGVNGNRRLFPHEPTREERVRRATGWQFNIDQNTQATPNIFTPLRSMHGSGEWGHGHEMNPYTYAADGWQLGQSVAAWSAKAESMYSTTIVPEPPGFWTNSHAGHTNFNDANKSGWANYTNNSLANPSVALQKQYDIIVGPFEAEDFSDVDTLNPIQPAIQFDDNALRITPTWSPFAETWRPIEELADGDIGGYGWRWPSMSPSGPDAATPTNALPYILATPDRIFSNPDPDPRDHYMNDEFRCGFYIAAAFPDEFLGMTSDSEIAEKLSRDLLDSGCANEKPKDNILIKNPNFSIPGDRSTVIDAVGRWARITWAPNYNDLVMPLSQEVPPNEFPTLQDWEDGDPEDYDKRLDEELTKCYKIMYLPNSEKFNKLMYDADLLQRHETSDGQRGFHKRSIGRIEMDPRIILQPDGTIVTKQDGYESCEKCATECVITSCDGARKFIVKYPAHFKSLKDDSIIFDDRFSWKLSYRIVEGEFPLAVVPPTGDECFKLSKENPYKGLNSDEHGNSLSPDWDTKEVEIVSFHPEENQIATTSDLSKNTLPRIIPASHFLDWRELAALSSSSGNPKICDTIDYGDGPEDICIEGVDCDKCFEKAAVVIDPPDPVLNPYPDGPPPDDPPYDPPPTPLSDDPPAIQAPTVLPIIGPQFTPDIEDVTDPANKGTENGKIKVSIKDFVIPADKVELTKRIYGGPMPLVFWIEVSAPGVSFTKATTDADLQAGVEIPVDWTKFEGASPRELQGSFKVWFYGLKACGKEILFDYQCDTFHRSSPYDHIIDGLGKDCPSHEFINYLDIPHIDNIWMKYWLMWDDTEVNLIGHKVTTYDEEFFPMDELEISDNLAIAIFGGKVKDQELYKIEDLTEATPHHTVDYKYSKNYEFTDSSVYSKKYQKMDHPSDAPLRHPTERFLGEDSLNKGRGSITDDYFSKDSDPLHSNFSLNDEVHGMVGDVVLTMSHRCFFVHVIDPAVTQGFSRSQALLYGCRSHDGITLKQLTDEEVGLKSVSGAAYTKGIIKFLTESSSSTTRQKPPASGWRRPPREIISVPIQKEDISNIEDILPRNIIYGETRQIVRNGTPAAFFHSRGGNSMNSSPQGKLSEASNQDLLNFLNAVKVRDDNEHSDLSKSFSVGAQDFLWTSKLSAPGQDSSMSVEVMNEGNYEDLNLEDISLSNIQQVGPDTFADKTIYISNSSTNKYIIEVSTMPKDVEDFEVCGTSSVALPLKIDALTSSSRAAFNKAGGNSKFHILNPTSTTKIEFLYEKILNRDSLSSQLDDESAAVFFRVVGGFYENKEKDFNTYLVSFDENFTNTDFDLWVLLPTPEFSTYNIKESGGSIAVPPANVTEITWDGVDYKLILIASSQGSTSTSSNIQITP